MTSSLPNVETAVCTMALTSASFETSHFNPTAPQPGYCTLILAVTASNAGSWMSPRTKRAPSAANWMAVSSPMPLQ